MEMARFELTAASLPMVVMAAEAVGEPVFICRDGEPIATVVPLPQKATKSLRTHRRSPLDPPNPLLAKTVIKYDPCEQVSDEDWMTPLP